jgi:surface antigen
MSRGSQAKVAAELVGPTRGRPTQRPLLKRRSGDRLTRWLITTVLALVAMGVSTASAFAADDYPADCAPVQGENCRTASLDAYVDHWGFYSRECTSFAAWRVSRRGPFHNTMRGGHFGNANTWGANAQRIGFPVDDNPVPGAVAWTTAGAAGHVAIVEAVNSNGTVTVEEYNYAVSGRYGRRTVARSAFRYIHIYDGGSGTLGEGSFVAAPDGAVYRIAGGAPIYVSSWDSFGGPQPVTGVSHEQLNALRPWPKDGTFISSNQDGAVYRIAGGAPIYVSTWDTYGGPQPTVGIDKWAVDNPGHPAAHLRAVPADGTFVNSNQDGAVYRIAGGAPIYVSTWDTYGGPQPTVGIDKWAVDNPGHPGAHLRAVPENGTFVNSNQDGAVYRIAGGAPIYVSTWDTYGGPQPTVGIDKWAVDNPGHPAAHLRAVPANGTLLNSNQDGAVYRVAGGAPIYVSTWDAVGGPQPTVGIDKWAVDNPGHPAAHLRGVPENGTFLNSSSGAVYRVAGGAPIFVSDWALFGGVRPFVTVDKWAIENTANPAAHLNRVPSDGTRVKGLPSRSYWSFSSGTRTLSTANSNAVDVDDVGLAAFSQSGTESQSGSIPSSPRMPSEDAESAPAGREQSSPTISAIDLSALTRVGKKATIDRIAKRGRYSTTFTASRAGTLTVIWARAGGKRTVVARGRVVFAKPTTKTIDIRLTKAGVRIFRRAGRLKISVAVRFAPPGAPRAATRGRLILRRAKAR